MKLMRLINIIYLIIIVFQSYAQSSFEIQLEIAGKVHCTDGLETNDGGYIFLVNNFKNPPEKSHPYIIKTSASGDIVDSLRIDYKDYMALLRIIHDEVKEEYLVFGIFASYPDLIRDSIIVIRFSYGLEIKEAVEIAGPFQNEEISLSDVKRNISDQFILTGWKTVPLNFGFIYILDSNLMLFNQALFNDASNMFYSINEFASDDSSGYLVSFSGKPPGFTSYGEYIAKLNYNLDLIDIYPSHILFGWSMTNITKYTDTVFIVTGKYNIPGQTRDVGVEKVDHYYNLLASNIFGKHPDTIDFPGVYSGAAVIDNDNIFIPGTSNVDTEQYPYSPMLSMFMLNKVDGDLNLQWQKFYGGDAYYSLAGIIPSSDGGCVMLGTRYHPDNPTGIDGYILKVGPDGLVSVPEVPGGLQVKEVILYPNPGLSKLHIQSGHDDLELMMCNAEGKIIHTERLTQYHHLINTASWPSGMYIYRITKNNEIFDSGKWIRSE